MAYSFQKTLKVFFFWGVLSVFFGARAESLLSRDAKIEQELSILYGDAVGDWKHRDVTQKSASQSPVKVPTSPQREVQHQPLMQQASQEPVVMLEKTPHGSEKISAIGPIIEAEPLSKSPQSTKEPLTPQVKEKESPITALIEAVPESKPTKNELVLSTNREKSVEKKERLSRTLAIDGLTPKATSPSYQDDKKTFKSFQTMAKRGDATGQFNLGLAYEMGFGVQEDLKKAAEWYARAALQNHPSALLNLGLLFYQGKGVKKDISMAIDHFTRSAQLGNALAQFNLSHIYFRGDVLTKSPSLALEWLKKSAENGYAVAQYQLGNIYIDGDIIDQNVQEAIGWYGRAAAQGLKDAQAALGLAYEKGYGVTMNRTEALRWYALAANQGHQGAIAKLNRLNEN